MNDTPEATARRIEKIRKCASLLAEINRMPFLNNFMPGTKLDLRESLRTGDLGSWS